MLYLRLRECVLLNGPQKLEGQFLGPQRPVVIVPALQLADIANPLGKYLVFIFQKR